MYVHSNVSEIEKCIITATIISTVGIGVVSITMPISEMLWMLTEMLALA